MPLNEEKKNCGHRLLWGKSQFCFTNTKSCAVLHKSHNFSTQQRTGDKWVNSSIQFYTIIIYKIYKKKKMIIFKMKYLHSIPGENQ